MRIILLEINYVFVGR